MVCVRSETGKTWVASDGSYFALINKESTGLWTVDLHRPDGSKLFTPFGKDTTTSVRQAFHSARGWTRT